MNGRIRDFFILKGLKLKFGFIIAALFVVWIAMGAYINFYRYESMTGDEVKKDAEVMARVLAAALSRDMSASDYEGLGAVIDPLAAEKDVDYVKVTDSSGGVVKEAGTLEAKGMLTATRKIEDGGVDLGSVTVGISTKEHLKLMRSQIVWQAIAVMLLGLVSLYVLVYSFNRQVLKPLDRMNSILKGMAAGGGDLTQRLDFNTSDEIGELAENFNTFLGRLRELVVKAQSSAFRVLGLTERIGEKTRTFLSSTNEQASSTNSNFKALERMDRSVQDVAGSADSLSITATDSSATVTEMAAQVDVVADSTTDLSGHVEEASSSIGQMTISIKEVAENVRALADLASNTADSVGRIEVSIKDVEEKAKQSATLSQEVMEDAYTLGNEAIANTIDGMERIRETVEETSGVIERLGARSAEIGSIVKVIDEITKQTSLLALNAAILAAQTGEHGKGFAVVADEIKDLAERTSSSTDEIARLIKSVQSESKAAVDSMRAGKERVLEGAQMAYGAADALKKILESSNRSKETAKLIEAATTRQVSSVREVAAAITNVHHRIKSIERATEEQSKGSEHIASAAEKMNDIAREVRRAMAEQSKGIKEFARSLEDTKEVVGTIADATKTQSAESSGLVRSMEGFLETTQNNSDIAKEMEGAVKELLSQAAGLRDEMGRFRV